MNDTVGVMRRPNARGRVLAAVLAALALTIAFDGAAAAQPLRYRILPDATDDRFRATSRLMNADGRFHRTSGEVRADPKDLSTAAITFQIDATSIDTGIGLRDLHLRSDDFLHVERFPNITFESVRVEASGRRAVV